MAANKFPPSNSCDCHLHIIGPKSIYSLADKRAFTPADAPLADLIAMHKRLGIDRCVLIQTSVFGYDNSCMLNGLSELGRNARGVAVLPGDTDTQRLDEMHRLGIRGIRVNVATYGSRPMAEIAAQIAATVKLCERNGWHVQLFLRADALEALAPTIAALPVDCVIDHFGLISPHTQSHSAEAALIALLQGGRTWVKISGAYRLGHDSNNDVDDPRIGALARRLYQANPDRIVWGTDWPHTPVHGAAAVSDLEEPFRAIDPADLLEGLRSWFDDADATEQILVRNPEKLYGFE